MIKNFATMKTKQNKLITILFFSLFLTLVSFKSFSQDTTAVPTPTNNLVTGTFESGFLIDDQTVVVQPAKTLEFAIQHRFGLVNSVHYDMFGIYSSSNIRLGLNYSINDRIQLGLGTTRMKSLQDISIKAALLRQTESGSMPLSVSYFGVAAMDGRNIYDTLKFADRMCYFNQLIIARKFGEKFSMQVAPSFTHYNMVDTLLKNDVIGISINARYKFSPTGSVVIGYDHQLTKQDTSFKIKPMFSIGVEFATFAHCFQIFLGTANGILNSDNMFNNTNDFTKTEILFGFNITRLWNFKK